MPDVAAVLVNHMSADRMEAAIASIRGEFREAGISGEVIVVDCASGAEEVRALGPLGWPAGDIVDIDGVNLDAAWEATGGDEGGPPEAPGGVNPDHAAASHPAVEALP